PQISYVHWLVAPMSGLGQNAKASPRANVARSSSDRGYGLARVTWQRRASGRMRFEGFAREARSNDRPVGNSRQVSGCSPNLLSLPLRAAQYRSPRAD